MVDHILRGVLRFCWSKFNCYHYPQKVGKVVEVRLGEIGLGLRGGYRVQHS